MADIAAKGKQGQRVELRADNLGRLYIHIPTLLYISGQHVTSSDGTANSLTVPNGAVTCHIDVFAADVYYDFGAGSTTPASGVGKEMLIGEGMVITGRDKMLGFRAVRQGSVDFTLKVFYYAEQLDERA